VVRAAAHFDGLAREASRRARRPQPWGRSVAGFGRPGAGCPAYIVAMDTTAGICPRVPLIETGQSS
jgi:hypothetical protein